MISRLWPELWFSSTARRELAAIGVHHVHGNALSLDQVAFRINGAAAVSPALYYLALYAISGAVLLGEKVLPSR